jgi:TadE-like protein
MSGFRTLATRRAHHRASHGQSLVEFALVLPVFVLLFMGLFDLGRVVYAQHTLTQDAREASRQGQVTPVYSVGKYQAIRHAALAQAPGVDLKNEDITGAAGACSGVTPPPAPVPPDDPTSPGTCFYPDGIAIADQVVVNISVTVPLVTPILSQIVGGSITVTAQSVSYIQ